MRPLWVLSPLILGAAFGFLSLEVIGIPLMLLSLGLLVAISRRSGQLSATLVSFGAGFSGAVGFFAIVTSGLFSGYATFGLAFWFVLWFAFGAALVVAGVRIRARRSV